MNINRFGATLLVAIVVALPVQANDGGKGGGDAAQRLLQQQQQQEEEQQQQEEEQIPEAAAPASAPPTDAASVAARDFYSKVVTHLDGTIEQQRQKLKALDTQIAGNGHKLAADFANARAGDKTTDDAIDSAKQTLDSMPKSPKVYGVDLAKTTWADVDLVAATNAIVEFKATAESIKALEAARADMAAAGKAYGATIN